MTKKNEEYIEVKTTETAGEEIKMELKKRKKSLKDRVNDFKMDHPIVCGVAKGIGRFFVKGACGVGMAFLGAKAYDMMTRERDDEESDEVETVFVEEEYPTEDEEIVEGEEQN